MGGNESRFGGGGELGVTICVFFLLAGVNRGLRFEFVVERFLGVKFRLLRGMERITGEGTPLCGGIRGRFRRRWGKDGFGAERGSGIGFGSAEIAHDGLIEGWRVDIEVEEGEGIAAVFQGVEGRAAFALRGFGAAGSGGEEGGSALPFPSGHGAGLRADCRGHHEAPRQRFLHGGK